jgi:hypothetical protein
MGSFCGKAVSTSECYHGTSDSCSASAVRAVAQPVAEVGVVSAAVAVFGSAAQSGVLVEHVAEAGLTAGGQSSDTCGRRFVSRLRGGAVGIAECYCCTAYCCSAGAVGTVPEAVEGPACCIDTGGMSVVLSRDTKELELDSRQ